MYKWQIYAKIAVIFSAIVLAILVVTLLSQREQVIVVTHEFMPENKAIKIVEQQYPAASVSEQAYFALLKYDQSEDHFLLAEASSVTGSIINDIIKINFSHGRYLSEEKSDRFVWVVSGGPPSLPRYIVDAKSGEIVGYWTPCPQCG